MTRTVVERYVELQGHIVSDSMQHRIYGTNFQDVLCDGLLGENQYSQLKSSGLGLTRESIELFLYSKRLYTKKEAAFKLGVSVESWPAILEAVHKVNSYITMPDVNNAFFEKRFVDSIYENFNELRYTIFSDHDIYLSDLHGVIRKYSNKLLEENICPFFKKAVEKKIDPNLQNKISKFGVSINCITGEGVGITNRIPVVSLKPAYAEPDYISIIDYVQDFKFLQGNTFADSKPILPDYLIKMVMSG